MILGLCVAIMFLSLAMLLQARELERLKADQEMIAMYLGEMIEERLAQ